MRAIASLFSFFGGLRNASEFFFFFFRSISFSFHHPRRKRGNAQLGWLALSSLVPSASFPHARTSLLSKPSLASGPAQGAFFSSPRTFFIFWLFHSFFEKNHGRSRRRPGLHGRRRLPHRDHRGRGEACGRACDWRESERERGESGALSRNVWGRATKDAPFARSRPFFFTSTSQNPDNLNQRNNRTPSRASCSPASGTSTCAGSPTFSSSRTVSRVLLCLLFFTSFSLPVSLSLSLSLHL